MPRPSRPNGAAHCPLVFKAIASTAACRSGSSPIRIAAAEIQAERFA
jgi:hypothetical protein